MKAGQPLPKTPVVGVDVLHVDGASGAGPDTLSGAEIDGLVRDAMGTREGWIGAVGIGDQQHLWIELRQQMPGQVHRLERPAACDGIDGLSAAVARHQDAIEFARNTPPAGPAAAFAWLAAELA